MRQKKKKGSRMKGKDSPGMQPSPDVEDEKPAGETQPKEPTFPIVGVGASAGGLEAFTQLLEDLPVDSGMAFVLVQHLAATHESMLTDLLSKVTPMPVREVKDGMAVEPDNVYVIPPNTEMAILHCVLHLMPREDARGHHMPVDSFLRSLAEDRGDDAIAIVMSGSGSDGSLGVCAIKAAGGITFAQEEKSAKYSGMPGSAIATGCVDFILQPDKIASELLRISHHPYLASAKPEKIAQAITAEGDTLSKLFILLRTATGVDFTYYKLSTIKRRVLRRMLLHRIETIENYIKYVREHPSEVEALYQDILINVTSFFREPKTYDALKSSVFPHIAGKASNDTPIRLWIPGGSTGEEAYSLAICLLEFLDERKLTRPIQIFATDIDETAIEKARKGIYPENISKAVSSERLRRFFIKTESGYQISKSIRDMCIFAKQNLVKDPPFSKIDLISCRNVLIYFGPILQKKALPILHYALNPTGFLMLGTSETTGECSGLFTLVDKKSRIYSKKSSLSKLYFEQPLEEYGKEKAGTGKKMKEHIPSLADIQKEADSIILNKYGPPGVVINSEMTILQFKGDTSLYFEHAPGEASLDLMKMAREGLTVELRSAIFEARKESAPVKKEGVRVKQNNRFKLVDIEVIPFKAPVTKDLYFLILFEEPIKPEPPGTGTDLEPPSMGKQRAASKEPADDEELILLRHELAAAREYLTSVTTEHETANEELRALNEELQSSNEEMQSINEELETAQEELQSTNEELTTVNDELQSRNEEMTLLNNDLINILSGIEIPVVLLGNELQIRRFNPSAGKILNLIASDVGRPITDIRTSFDVPEFKQMIVGVMDTLAAKEREIQDTDGRWYSVMIRPYKTIDNRIDGVLMTFVDINELKHVEEAIRKSEKILRDITSTLAEGIYVINEQGHITFMNAEAERLFGRRQTEFSGRNAHDIIHSRRPDGTPLTIEDCHVHKMIKSGGRYDSSDEVFTHKDGTIFPAEVHARSIMEGDKIVATVLAFQNITERKQAEAERERIISELKEAVANVKQLSGMLPICSSCKKIRDDKGYWSELESYITNHSDALFNHSYCPECGEKAMKEIEKLKEDTGR